MHPALAQLVIPASALAAALFVGPASAAGPSDAPLPVMVGGIALQRVVLHRGGDGGGTAGACNPVVSTHTNASFEGGQYIAQGGFAEQEVAAVSFTLPASAFPVRIDLAEMIFATSGATVTTTTRWSVMFWEGTPASGTLAFSASSDGELLPHLVMQPGTNGTNIQFMIDPGDAEQIILQDNGSRTISFGYRIDRHNAQTQNPCVVAPPSSANAFPCTDVGGLQHPSNNWLYAIDCGVFGCPAGWRTFAQLPTGCRPSGDWVIRATGTPVNCAPVGACCLPGGGCQAKTESECIALGGTYQGPGSACSGGGCAPQTGPCCFASTGGCLQLSSATCLAAGGVPGPAGVSCSGYVCFPSGACCLPNGTCTGPVSPSACQSLGGVFQGNGTSCAGLD
ncbi:MAG: hypothetical protein ACKOQW_09480, partial [Phycisphaerales bacterium]